MLLGLGSDIVDIRRVEMLWGRFGTRFIRRVFTVEEQCFASNRKDMISVYAKRFAAKEACSKALGFGISSGISWLDISVSNDHLGKPSLRLTGMADKYLKSSLSYGYVPALHLSMSDEYPMAFAVVIISAVKDF